MISDQLLNADPIYCLSYTHDVLLIHLFIGPIGLNIPSEQYSCTKKCQGRKHLYHLYHLYHNTKRPTIHTARTLAASLFHLYL